MRNRIVVTVALILLLLGVAPASNSAGTQVHLAALPDGADVPSLAFFVDPCLTMAEQLAALGYNPASADPRVERTMQNAWGLLLPVLAEIAADPALAGDPRAVQARIAEQVRRSLAGSRDAV